MHVATAFTPHNCSVETASCILFAVTGSTFSENTAEIAGGAIFVQHPDILRYACSSRRTEIPPAPYTADVIGDLDFLASAHDVCPNWSRNRAGRYGHTVASYATNVLEFAERGSTTGNRAPIKGNHLVATNHRSGDPLPIVQMEVLDGFGQGPPLGQQDQYITATIRSPSGFFTGSINMLLDEKLKGFPPISSLQSPGPYEIYIDFSEPGIERFIIEIEVRQCRLGEVVQEDGKLCVSCSGSLYNFDLNASECSACPDNGNCAGNAIQPVRGYWHRSPCSAYIKQCISREACDFADREKKLTTATETLESCEQDEQLADAYARAQCKKV